MFPWIPLHLTIIPLSKLSYKRQSLRGHGYTCRTHGRSGVSLTEESNFTTEVTEDTEEEWKGGA